VEAGKEQRIELTYWEILNYESGNVSYLYPMKAEVAGLPAVNFSFSMTIVSAIPVGTVACDTHPLNVNTREPRRVTLGFEAQQFAFDRDLGLRYVLQREKIGVDVICYRPEDKDGYFLALVTPPEGTEKVVPKAMTFVIDVSGSMSGEKIEQAKNSLLYCVHALQSHDIFNIVTFETSVSSFENTLISASQENKEKAWKYIRGLGPLGSTDLNGGLQQALSYQIPLGMPYVVVLLTDGLPTSGETNREAILKMAKTRCTEGCRLFTFGVGYDVDRNLLDTLAQDNKGASMFLRPGENFEFPLAVFFRKLANPVLTQIKLDFGGTTVSQLFPQVVTDLFKGMQIVITGRYRNPGNYPVKLSGFQGSDRIELVEEVQFPARETQNEFIGRLWAGKRMDYLLPYVKANPETQEIVDEIISLSKSWGIITPYTSYLVLESDADYVRWKLEQIKKDEPLTKEPLTRDTTVTTGTTSNMPASGPRATSTQIGRAHV
jgi:Ca-activated chloride channel family protein